MKLKNTSGFSNELVREVIKFVRPGGLSKFSVQVQNTRHVWGGHGGYSGVLVKVGHEKKYPRYYYPYQYGQFKGKKYWLKNKEETLVVIMAHELRHTWQARKPKRGYVWGSRGVYSEIDTEAWAIKMLRAWRNRKSHSSPECTPSVEPRNNRIALHC